MPTPASGASAYCTPESAILRYDWRLWDQLLSDEEAPNYSPPRDPAAAKAALAASPILALLLKQAAGWIESSATVGKAYVIDATRNDLASLTGNSAELLAGCNAGLALWLAYSRRPNLLGADRLPALAQAFLDWMDKLEQGRAVFGLAENQAAANLSSRVEPAAEVEARAGITYEAQRLFGRRNNRLHG